MKIGYTQRAKGERYEDWAERERQAQLRTWRLNKKCEGSWLSAEEYEKRTGRPGMRDC